MLWPKSRPNFACHLSNEHPQLAPATCRKEPEAERQEAEVSITEAASEVSCSFKMQGIDSSNDDVLARRKTKETR